MKINEVAKLTGITVRTLHYYDEIGLLKPSETTETGYRLYDHHDLEILQQILFFKELEFPLSEIKEIMNSPQYDKKEALVKQRTLMHKKRLRMDNIIRLLDDAIDGKKEMSFEAFDTKEIEDMKDCYAQEVKKRWGKTAAYKEYQDKTAQNQSKDWKEIEGQCANIFEAFAASRHLSVQSDEVQELVRKWQECISNHFYQCTNEILEGLGQMYVFDERFKKNLDQYGDGTAEFMSQAIALYCERNR